MNASTDDLATETASTVSQASAAVVSLYNSWASSSDFGSLYDDDDTLQESDRFARLPSIEADMPLCDPEELLKQLRLRCKDVDLPCVPAPRQRQRPLCRFLNHMGTRSSAGLHGASYTTTTAGVAPHLPTLFVLQQTSADDLDLGLDEKDALFPMGKGKAKHTLDKDDVVDGESCAKKQKTES